MDIYNKLIGENQNNGIKSNITKSDNYELLILGITLIGLSILTMIRKFNKIYSYILLVVGIILTLIYVFILIKSIITNKIKGYNKNNVLPFIDGKKMIKKNSLNDLLKNLEFDVSKSDYIKKQGVIRIGYDFDDNCYFECELFKNKYFYRINLKKQIDSMKIDEKMFQVYEYGFDGVNIKTILKNFLFYSLKKNNEASQLSIIIKQKTKIED